MSEEDFYRSRSVLDWLASGEAGGSLTDEEAGYLEGAAAAFGIMGMAEAIRETYCRVCRSCGDVRPRRMDHCACEDDS
jgi:hypothetical protein